MTDAIVEKLVQIVTQLIEQIGDVILRIEKLELPTERVNQIFKRIDSINGAMKEWEQGSTLEKERLTDLTDSVNSTVQKVYRLLDKLEDALKAIDERTKLNTEQWVKFETDRRTVRLMRLINTGVLVMILCAVLFR